MAIAMVAPYQQDMSGVHQEKTTRGGSWKFFFGFHHCVALTTLSQLHTTWHRFRFQFGKYDLRRHHTWKLTKLMGYYSISSLVWWNRTRISPKTRTQVLANNKITELVLWYQELKLVILHAFRCRCTTKVNAKLVRSINRIITRPAKDQRPNYCLIEPKEALTCNRWAAPKWPHQWPSQAKGWVALSQKHLMSVL